MDEEKVKPDADDWEAIQNETGTDILTIVMNLVTGNITAGQTMDAISTHCQTAYNRGYVNGKIDEGYHNFVPQTNTFDVSCTVCGNSFDHPEARHFSKSE
jgi:hypothetical protein